MRPERWDNLRTLLSNPAHRAQGDELLELMHKEAPADLCAYRAAWAVYGWLTDPEALMGGPLPVTDLELLLAVGEWLDRVRDIPRPVMRLRVDVWPMDEFVIMACLFARRLDFWVRVREGRVEHIEWKNGKTEERWTLTRTRSSALDYSLIPSRVGAVQ